ncbi:MarR family winged helix-turn-helix transcriptional regulator [Rhodopirellula sp. P2]|uniref:MarR family winged helix-turn-helix transcriptional regulator n=1 Tax=Rhodopirellula sp. P2 TaxID=2127060 RepID=UPI00236812C1|nr:MarR family transcriptional regulator [Rhodopirellula sp. P2]WDQ17263.1 MarR family transcriptional regulator [Rhodopirellula sp. P2]
MTPSSLREELKKKGPFESLEQEAMLGILRTSDLLENRLARLLRKYGLTPSQYNAMRIMRGDGEPMPCLEVADRMIQVAPAITRVVDQLLHRELVHKKQSSQDRRVFLVGVTEEGLALLSQLDEPIQNLHRELLGHVSAEDLQSLNRILQIARGSVSE